MNIDFKTLILENGKELNCVKNHTIEVFDQEIYSIFKLNSSDKFLLTFFDNYNIKIYKIVENKIKHLQEVNYGFSY